MLLAWLSVALPAAAQDIAVDGVPLADRVTLSGHRLVLNGAGLRTIWGFHIYVAALYLPEKSRDPADVLSHDVPRRLQITLRRDATTEQNLDALKGGLIANNSSADLAAIDADVVHFLGLLRQMHEIPEGTVIRLDYQPGQGTQVRLGEKTLGTVPGERFNLAVLRIWLGEDPIQRSLKKALLGLETPSL